MARPEPKVSPEPMHYPGGAKTWESVVLYSGLLAFGVLLAYVFVVEVLGVGS